MAKPESAEGALCIAEELHIDHGSMEGKEFQDSKNIPSADQKLDKEEPKETTDTVLLPEIVGPELEKHEESKLETPDQEKEIEKDDADFMRDFDCFDDGFEGAAAT